MAAALAGFGMLLRDSEFKGSLTYSEVLKTIQDLPLMDDQDKWELVRMVETASLLSDKKTGLTGLTR